MISEFMRGMDEVEEDGKVDVYQMSDYFEKTATDTPTGEKEEESCLE